MNEEFVGKSFIAKVIAVCEETAEPNPCAGYQIFLELHFKKYNLIITEKAISTCQKVRYEESFLTEWTFENPNKIILKKLNEDGLGNKFLDSNILIYKNDILIGKPAKNNTGDYEFKKILR